MWEDQEMKQALIYIPARQQWVNCSNKPTKLALITGSVDPVEFPVTFERGRGVFLEDNIHDWNWKNGKLRYHGCGEPPCWVVVEF